MPPIIGIGIAVGKMPPNMSGPSLIWYFVPPPPA
jgi:hypothetical protein